VEVDVGPHRELCGDRIGVAGLLERLGTPLLDQFLLGRADVCLGGWHRHFSFLSLLLFGKTRDLVLPMPGDFQI